MKFCKKNNISSYVDFSEKIFPDNAFCMTTIGDARKMYSIIKCCILRKFNLFNNLKYNFSVFGKNYKKVVSQKNINKYRKVQTYGNKDVFKIEKEIINFEKDKYTVLHL